MTANGAKKDHTCYTQQCSGIMGTDLVLIVQFCGCTASKDVGR